MTVVLLSLCCLVLYHCSLLRCVTTLFALFTLTGTEACLSFCSVTLRLMLVHVLLLCLCCTYDVFVCVSLIKYLLIGRSQFLCIITVKDMVVELNFSL